MGFDILNLRYCNILILIIYFFAFHSVDRRVDIKSSSWTFFEYFLGFFFFLFYCVYMSRVVVGWKEKIVTLFAIDISFSFHQLLS